MKIFLASLTALVSLPALALDANCGYDAVSALGEKSENVDFNVSLTAASPNEFSGKQTIKLNSNHQAEVTLVYQNPRPSDDIDSQTIHFHGRLTLGVKVFGTKEEKIVSLKGQSVVDSDEIRTLLVNEKSPYLNAPVTITQENAGEVFRSLLGAVNVRKYALPAVTSVRILDLENALLQNPGRTAQEILASSAEGQTMLSSVVVSCVIDFRKNAE